MQWAGSGIREIWSLFLLFHRCWPIEGYKDYGQLLLDPLPAFPYLSMGVLQQIKGDTKGAKKTYETAFENGQNAALLSLANLEFEKPAPNIGKEIKYIQKAYQLKIDGAAISLAKVYLNQTKLEDKGVEILKEEVESGNNAAAHLLAHYYSDKKLFKESDSYFIKAYELGRRYAALCQASEIFNHGRSDRKSLALELFKQNMEIVLKASIPTKLEYAAILLWNDHIEEAGRILKEQVLLLPEIFEKQLEKDTGNILAALTQYFALLISNGLTRLANSCFADKGVVEFKQIIRPVYFALMHYMKKDYPSEFLKAGNELKDTVQEIIEKIEQFKKQI